MNQEPRVHVSHEISVWTDLASKVTEFISGQRPGNLYVATIQMAGPLALTIHCDS